MIGLLASLALLGAFSALGVALLSRARHFTRLERVAWGAPIGMTVGTLALVPFSTLVGFRTEVVVTVGFASAIAAARLHVGPGLWIGEAGPRLRAWLADVRKRATVPNVLATLRALRRGEALAVAVLAVFAVRWLVFWRDAVVYRTDGLWGGHINIWGDWAVHFGIVSSFVYGANFPPEHPRFANYPLGYHYLADLTAAAQVTLGMTSADALALHSLIGCVLVAVGLYAFARRMTRDRAAAAVAVVLFLLGGGLGWLATVAAVQESGDLLGTLGRAAWDRNVKGDLNMQFVNMFYGFLAPQRAFLYGLPIAFAAVATLLVAVRRGDLRTFAVAGVIAGLLPLAHLATLLALALVTPILFLLFPSRGWILFHVVWVAVALPQLLTQLGGGGGALSAFRLNPGWVAGTDPWPVFWLKNLGLFAPLLVVALLGRRLLPPRPKRFLLAFMGVFVAANLVAFQPWDWDNHKILVYWFLAGAILVAALVVRAWRDAPSPVWRGAIALVVGSIVMSGVLEDVGTLLGQSRFHMVSAEEMQLAAQVRATTAPDALFVIGLRNRDPIAMFTGRRIFVGYPGWLWTEGVPYGDRERIVRSIYKAEDGWLEALRENEIDYVVIGPPDRKDLEANEVAFRERFPVATRTHEWTIYDVRGLRARAGG